MSQWNIYKWLEEFKGNWTPAQGKKIFGWSEKKVTHQVKYCFWHNQIIRFWIYKEYRLWKFVNCLKVKMKLFYYKTMRQF
jgi:hypothetical protein